MNRMQHVHDAIKKMRAEGEAWLTHEGERLRIRPLREEDTELRRADIPRPEGIFEDADPCMISLVDSCPEGFWFPYYKAFIKAVRVKGGVVYGDVWWHEGRLHCYAPVMGSRCAEDDIVLALVVERHPRGSGT